MTKKNYQYIFYGLKVNSQIPLDPLEPVVFEEAPDISIKLGTIQRPQEGQEKTIYKPSTIFNQKFFLLVCRRHSSIYGDR